jgi:hypothetical protein
MPDLALFSDVGDEPQEVYDWLDWLEQQLPFPVIRTSYNGQVLSEQVGKERPTGKFLKMPIPAWIQLSPGEEDERSGGLLRRQCTVDYKIRPLIKEVRKQLGIFGKRTPEGVLVTQWIGISLDEIQRMKDSRESFIEHRWPLIEKRITRQQCIAWMNKHYDVTPPRSACTFCPFHDNAEWRHIKKNYPDKWQHAIEMDRKIRHIWASQDSAAEFFLHRDRVPLEIADLSEKKGVDGQMDLFGFENECEGMCGV